MKKRSVAKIIFTYFFKTLGIIALLAAAGVLGYYLTMLYYRQTARTERSTTYKHVIDVNAGNESANLIYCYDAKSKKIKTMVLELLDKSSSNLAYITVPADTKITMSASTYEELLQVSQKVPQVAVMSEINEYFSGDVAYEYGIKILQEEWNVDIGYFTAISSDKFDQYFENAGTKKKPKYTLSQTLIGKMKACKDAKAMSKLMKNSWDDMISDLTLSQKQGYAEAFQKVNADYIRTYRVKGTQSTDGFLLDNKKNTSLVNKIWESEPFSGKQGETSLTTDITKYKVQVTNGTGIDGLASAYQEKLKAQGWNVIGVGNYQGIKQTSTTIYTKNKAAAKELKSFFKNASIVKQEEMTNGADIEILLGTEDALN